MFFAASFLVFVFGKKFLACSAPLKLMAWHQIYQITHILRGESSVTVVLVYTYKYIHRDNDDIAALVMRNKAIQVDTKPAGKCGADLISRAVFIFTFSQPLQTRILTPVLVRS